MSQDDQPTRGDRGVFVPLSRERQLGCVLLRVLLLPL